MKYTSRIIKLVLAVALCGACTAHADTKTWSGAGTSANWSDGANWTPAGAPVSGDDLVFDATINPVTLVCTNDILSLTNGSASFVNGSGTNWVISGNPILMTTNAASLTASEPGIRTINTDVTYSGNLTAPVVWAVNAGEVQVTGNLVASGTGAAAGYLAKQGEGSLRLQGPDNRFNSANGNPRIWAGNLIVDGGNLSVTNANFPIQALTNGIAPRLQITNGGSLTLGSAGQVTARQLQVGVGTGAFANTNYVDIDSGMLTVHHPGLIQLGNGATKSGVVNQSGGTVDLKRSNGAGIDLGMLSGATGTYNLNGGTLIVRTIQATQPGGAFNFNGGTLKAFWTNAPNFIQGTAANVTLNVLDGDAVVDTYSTTFATGINWNLVNSLNGVGAGGLVKKGAGELTLAAVNTINGAVQVQGGVLVFTDVLSLGDKTNTVTVSTGATLRGNGPQGDVFVNLIMESGSTYQNRGAGLRPSGPLFQLNGPVTFDVNAYLKINSSITNNAVNAGFTLTTTNTSATNTLQLDAAATYTLPGQIVVADACQLHMAGTVNAGGITIQSGGTLGVFNTFNAPTVIQSGAKFSPGFNEIIASATNDTTLTFQAGSTCNIQIDSTNLTTDQVLGLNSVTYGGNLVVTDVAGLSGDFTAGQTYQLFGATNYLGSFASITLPTLTDTNLAWNTSSLNVDGTIKVVSTVAPTSPPLIFSISGGNLNVSWTDASFRLQAQTNALGVGLGSAWFDYPGGATSPVSVPINPANGAVFLRLIYP